MPKINDRVTRQARKAVADANAADRATRTNEQQIEALDMRFGTGVGARKERKRLAA